jgi:hypothetical protein
MNRYKIITFLLLVGSAFCCEQDHCSKIQKELDYLKISNLLYKVPITESNTPVLRSVIDECLMGFSGKTGLTVMPPVYVYFSPANYDNYGFFYDGDGILLGNRLLELFFSNKYFEKYFPIMLAHEFGHFYLKHDLVPELQKEIGADKFALSVVDKPQELLDAHLFRYISVFLVLAMVELFNFCENTAVPDVSKIMLEIISSKQGLKPFYNFNSWQELNRILNVVARYLSRDNFVEGFVPSLEKMGNELLIKRSCFSRISDYFELDAGEIHPSPRYLSRLL